MTEGSQRIAVLCIGNILKCDDGVGPRVAAELNERFRFPDNVAVLDRATMGMQLLSEFSSFDVILTVDAVDASGAAPGTVLSFSPKDIARYDNFHGAHDTRFADVLDAAALLGYEVEGHCLGVQIGDTSPSELSIGLTSAVEGAIPLVLYSVLTFLTEHGVVVIDKKTDKPWDGITIG